MIDEKSLKSLEKGFENQILFLKEINDTLESIKARSKESIRNPQYDSSVRRNCIKIIINFRRSLKNTIESNIKPYQLLTELKKEIPLETSQLKIIEDFPNKLNQLYNQIILGIFGKDKNNISLNSLLDNRYYSLEDIILKTEKLIQIINESQNFIQTFLTNIKQNENKIISLQSEKDNFRIDFTTILKNSKIDINKEHILIFDSNFLIHYLEDQRIIQNKKEYRFFFPKKTKIITFEKNTREAKSKIFGNSKSIRKLVSYLESLPNSYRETDIGNLKLKNELFQIWLETGLNNRKDPNKFYNSLDLDILEFSSKTNPIIPIIIFSSDPDIIQVVKAIQNSHIQNRGLFNNKFFRNIRIISFDQNGNERKLKIAI